MANTKLAGNYKTHRKTAYSAADIIKANFPVYQSLRNIRLANLNKVLSLSLLSTMIFSFVMYSVVVCKQKQIEAIHYATKTIGTENIELKTKLDNLKSFDNVNAKIMADGNLQQPVKIIEVNTQIPNLKVRVPQKGKEIGSMLGY
ncbi:MAG: hypothetical protein PHE78_08695 [Candidatus Gastranaerophilales bacterium]|jgi:hypothetical protein|nr:hypothetical protein [Candidatus Gastranaerophilales bacterium]